MRRRVILHRLVASMRVWGLLCALLLLAGSLPTGTAHHVDPFEVIQVLWKNDIPAIYTPRFTQGLNLSPEEEVIGLTVGGEARAYPLKIMNWHEVVNDVVGGVPLAVTYCPLCGTGIVFDRAVEGEVLTLGVSGRLYRSNLVMFDNETGSLWSQLSGEALLGPLHGKKLQWMASSTLPWADWRARYPHSLLLSPPLPHCTGGRTGDDCRDYTVDPYRGYKLSTVVYSDFGGEYADTILHPKATVLGIEVEGVPMAYPFSILEETPVLHDVLHRQRIVVTFVNGSAQAFDPGDREFLPAGTGTMRDDSGVLWNRLTGVAEAGQSLRSLEAIPSMWFAWAEFRPGSGVYSLRPPSVLTFALHTQPSTVAKGEVLHQDVRFNNTSNLTLEEVAIRVDLPQGLEYVADDAPSVPGYAARSEEGSRLEYAFVSVSPGSHAFRITTRLQEVELQGIIFKSTISIEYQDADGRIITASRPGEFFEVVEREVRASPSLLYLLPLALVPAVVWLLLRMRRTRHAPENG